MHFDSRVFTASEKACLSLGDPSDKVTIQLKLILFARLVAFFGRPVEEKSAPMTLEAFFVPGAAEQVPSSYKLFRRFSFIFAYLLII